MAEKAVASLSFDNYRAARGSENGYAHIIAYGDDRIIGLVNNFLNRGCYYYERIAALHTGFTPYNS